MCIAIHTHNCTHKHLQCVGVGVGVGVLWVCAVPTCPSRNLSKWVWTQFLLGSSRECFHFGSNHLFGPPLCGYQSAVQDHQSCIFAQECLKCDGVVGIQSLWSTLEQKAPLIQGLWELKTCGSGFAVVVNFPCALLLLKVFLLWLLCICVVQELRLIEYVVLLCFPVAGCIKDLVFSSKFAANFRIV